MKNFKENMWSKIFFIFSMFSFVAFLNTTNVLAQATSETSAPAIEGASSDLGGEKALPKGEILPGDEATGGELLRTQAALEGAVPRAPTETDIFSAPPEVGEPTLGEIAAPGIPKELAVPEVEVAETAEKAIADAPEAAPLIEEGTAAPADLTAPAEEAPILEEAAAPEFVLASVEEQEALKTGVAELLLGVDQQTAGIMQGELATAISDGTIVLGSTGTDAATDVLPDQAAATVAQQLATSTDAQKVVLNNLTQLKQTLTAPTALGTGTSGTAAASPEALKSISTMEQAIKSGNQKAIQEAMKSAAETFKAFGSEMGMGGFGGPKGDFGPGGGQDPMGFGGGGFFDRAFAGVPNEMMKSFSEGPGGAFDRGRMAAEGFMADVGYHMIASMATDRPPEAVFREMAGMGFSVDIMTKAAEQFKDQFMNNPDAFRGPMGGGPMEGGAFRGPEGFAQGGQGTMPEFFGSAGNIPFDGGNFHGFDPAVASQGYQGGDLAKAFEAAGTSSKEFSLTPRETDFFRLDSIDAKLFLPSTSSIIAPVITSTQSGSGGGQVQPAQRIVFPGDTDVRAALATVVHRQDGHQLVYNKALFDPAVLASYRITMANSPAISQVTETADQIAFVWNASGGSLVDLNSKRVDDNKQHANEPPPPTIRPGDTALRSLVVSVNHLSSNGGGLHRINYAPTISAEYKAMLSSGGVPPISNYTVNPDGGVSLTWAGTLVDAIGQAVVAADVVHANEPVGPTQAQINTADKQLYYENYRVNSGQTAGSNWNTWLGQQNYSSQSIRDSIRTTVQTQKTDGNTTAQELADKRAAIVQLKADILEARVPNCHSLQLHNDPDVGAGKPEHDELSNIHCN